MLRQFVKAGSVHDHRCGFQTIFCFGSGVFDYLHHRIDRSEDAAIHSLAAFLLKRGDDLWRMHENSAVRVRGFIGGFRMGLQVRPCEIPWATDERQNEIPGCHRERLHRWSKVLCHNSPSNYNKYGENKARFSKTAAKSYLHPHSPGVVV